jgi:hypothetical protein
MRKSLLVLPAAAAVLMFGATAAAQAAPTSHPDSVVGVQLLDGNGTAGWYTNSFGATYSQVDGTFKLNLPSTDQLVSALQNGGIGISLCNATTGYTAQLGVIDTGAGEWTVVLAKGYLANTDPTGDDDPCQGNSFFNEAITGFGFTQLGTVPAGTTVQAQIKEVNHGLVYTVADSAVVNFNYFQPSYPGFFNEAGAGVSTDLDILSAPASNDLVDFSGVTATSAAGTHGFAYWNAVSVASGYPGYAPLIDSPSLTPSTFTRTWHPGHRYYWGRKGHRHYRWIKGYWTSSGGGPSSFSIFTGSPIGV